MDCEKELSNPCYKHELMKTMMIHIKRMFYLFFYYLLWVPALFRGIGS